MVSVYIWHISKMAAAMDVDSYKKTGKEILLEGLEGRTMVLQSSQMQHLGLQCLLFARQKHFLVAHILPQVQNISSISFSKKYKIQV